MDRASKKGKEIKRIDKNKLRKEWQKKNAPKNYKHCKNHYY